MTQRKPTGPSSRGKTAADALYYFGFGERTRECSKCGNVLPATSEFFATQRAVKIGISRQCHKCHNAERKRCRDRSPESHRAYSREWSRKAWAENPQQIRDYHNQRNARIRVEVLLHYSNGTLTCQCCQTGPIEFLCIDHIEGGGRRHRQEITGNIYDWLRRNKYPEGFRVLCHNCNMSRGLYGYCPHDKERETNNSSKEN